MSKRASLFTYLTVTACLSIIAVCAKARVIYVDDDGPADFNNIQAATDDANDGDTVVVSDGVYIGLGNRDIDFLGKAITVQSENGPEMCIIDCNGTADDNHRAFHFHNAEDTNAVLDGFTITNGYITLESHAGAILCEYSSPTIANCMFLSNTAKTAGGAIWNYQCTPNIINCLFAENLAIYGDGAAICNASSNTTITNCTFTANDGGCWSGGICNFNSNPTVSNCVFAENTGRWGGAMYNDTSSPKVSNCLFTGNFADSGGGAIYNSWSGTPTIVNCTFSSNSSNSGAAIYAESNTTVSVGNCIIWGNNGPEISGKGCNVFYSDIEGGWQGKGNINADPSFIHPAYRFDPATPDDPSDDVCSGDYHLRLGSPCIDAGDNLTVPPSVVTDLEGNPRLVDDPCTPDTGRGTPPIVDMGAYESLGSGSAFLLSTDTLIVPEGQTAAFTVALSRDPSGTVEVHVAVFWGDPDITVQDGAILIFNSSNYAEPQTATLAAAEDPYFLDDKTFIRIGAPGFATAILTAVEADNEIVPTIIYVDLDAPGANDGTSWVNAYTDLQGAMQSAALFPEIIEEIRVAQGVYTPAEPFSGASEATFSLASGIPVKGGYAGFGEPDPNARDFTMYETILGGDLGGNDVDVDDPCDLLSEPTRAENSYHVVTAIGTDNTAILDGFTITGGNGSYGEYGGYGGGIYCYRSSPAVANCTFRENSAGVGGGMFSFASSSTLTNCTFTRNSADTGGGLCNTDSATMVTDCTFSENFAVGGGGGIYNDEHNSELPHTTCKFSTFIGNSASYGGAISGGEGLISDCTITGNEADYGGGISGFRGLTANCTITGNTANSGGGGMAIPLDYMYSIVSHCIISGNSAGGNGGGVYSFGDTDPSNAMLICCVISGNSAGDSGGGIYGTENSSPVLKSCTLIGNRAQRGGGMYTGSWTEPELTNCTFSGNVAEKTGGAIDYHDSLTLTNSILWGDTPDEIAGGTDEIINSDIQGGWSGEGNIDADPCFADPGNWDPNGTPEDPNDDFWVDGDYHLKSQAGRWDANEGRWTIDDVTSSCIDAGDPMSPIMHEPFPNGGRVNMGAYGGTEEASKSYFGTPLCETIVAGDINGDCAVNFEDFRLMTLHWLEEH
jgi:predicted outer membrane repeat protein